MAEPKTLPFLLILIIKMKSTDYKDIFDWGEEALSFKNRSHTSFPRIKNAFKFGENIRGMTNVSPLTTVKFFNQSTEDILAKYYPDAQSIKSINSNLVLDESIKKNGYEFYKYEFFSDNNRNGSVEKNEELIFKLLLFVSTDGNKVKECYEVVKPADDEIIFFLETDDDTLSDDVLFGRTSEKIKKLYTDHSSGKLYKTFFDGDILEKIKKHAGNINQEIIEELFLKGYIEEKGIKQGFFTFLKYALMGISAPAKAFGWVLNKLGSGIDFFKISDEVWDTENEAYYFQKDKLIENLTISSDKIKSLKDFFTDKKDIDILGSDILKVVLDNIILQQITTLEAFIETYNNYVKEEIEEIFKTPEDLPPSDSPSLSERIALICGIWNGLIDFVSSIFKFFGSLLEAPFDISKNFQQTLEMIDTFWKMLRDGTLYKNMKSSFNYGMTQIVQYLKKNSDDINWVRVYYIGGFSLAFLGTFFIPLANVAKIANAGKPGEILAKINSEVGKTISQTAKFVKVNSIQAYQKVSRALIDLLEIFNVGGQKLKKFVDDLWKKIAEWFKKNIKIFNRVKWMSPGFFKFGDDGNTFRNFLKLRERNNDGYYNILCHGDPKSVFINGKKLKPQELADLILQQGYEKGEPIRLISCQTGAKPNGFAKKLAEILQTEVTAPTERIAVDDLGNFIHDKKGKFLTFKKD